MNKEKEMRWIARKLKNKFKDNNHNNKKQPLTELLYIICSTKTSENNYSKSYKSLRNHFPSYKSLLVADQKDIEKAIYYGGLAMQKAKAIKKIMERVNAIFGKPSLSNLKQWDDENCENFLTSLPRVGKKVARCVMMYSLGREVFPVDTHCWRIAKRLDWIKKEKDEQSCRPKDMDNLQKIIPNHLRFSLHVNMVSLGRQFCLPKNPLCCSCPIEAKCPKVNVK